MKRFPPNPLARVVCLFKDHEIYALVKWSPEVICMQLICQRCGKFVGHIDLPGPGEKVKKGVIH